MKIAPVTAAILCLGFFPSQSLADELVTAPAREEDGDDSDSNKHKYKYKYVTYGDDMLFRRSTVEQGRAIFQHSSNSRHQSSSRDMFWSLWKCFDDSKMEKSMWDTTASRKGRRTLRRFHYVVLPIWWDGEPHNSKTAMDRAQIQTMLNEAQQYYSDMSWGLNEVTFELWNQTLLKGVTAENSRFDNSEAAARAIVNERYVEFLDYTGILVVHHPGKGDSPFATGGWANVNDNFLWSGYPVRSHVIRHEVGHNYGHPHHLSNQYIWRNRKGEYNHNYDGWDMMSGGNEYAKSDLAAASKWYFNWITNDAVIMMQPEGSTANCPTCLASVQDLVLKPFDDVNVKPSSTNKMAVHIPILGTADDRKAYSYWLSYRSGDDGLAAGGLSVHISWLGLGGIFGASYDSLNYVAFGSEPTTANSFVVPETCYVIAPAAIMRDINIAATEQVQPIVCVDNVRKGKDITISVSFLDPDSPPADKVVPETKGTLGCSKSGTYSGEFLLDVSENKDHLFHYEGTEMGGTISVYLCLDSAEPMEVKAYFYDTYPYAYMALESPPSYGAYKSLSVSSTDCTGGSLGGEHFDYVSERGTAYILITAETSVVGEATVHFNSVCMQPDKGGSLRGHSNRFHDGNNAESWEALMG